MTCRATSSTKRGGARTIFSVACTLLAAPLLSSCTTAAPPAAPPPSIVLVTIDTLRADRVGAFGGPANLTPSLDALAARGVRFTDATAHSPLTVPSHASILTGRWPWTHGVRDNAGFPLATSLPTMAELLKDRGYRTAAFVSSYVLARSTGLARGFDTYVDRFDLRAARVVGAGLQRRGAEVAREAGAWLREARHSPQPFFLWVHFYDPHAPYDAPSAFADRWPGQPYNAEVAAADWAAGDLTARLSDASGRTIVAVTADHGESLDEHGEPEHGLFVYDATQRVPLILAGPGLPAGGTVDDQVRHIDLLPTVLELADLPAPPGLPGESLAPLARGGARRETPPSFAEAWFGRLHFGWSEVTAVRTGDWKYVRAPRPELYDLRGDPAETSNLVDARPDVAHRLASVLDGARAAADGAPVPAAEVDSAAAERLRSLGYIGAPGAAASGPEGADPKDRVGEYVAFVSAFYRALDEFEHGRAERAAAAFVELARRHPASHEAGHYAGRALFAVGRAPEALAEYERVIGLSPSFAAAYFDAARADAALGQIDRARGRLERGLSLEAGSFYGEMARGHVERAAGDLDAARRAFERALELNPGMALAHFELGRLAEERRASDEARRHYEAAVDADATFVEARRALDRLHAAAVQR